METNQGELEADDVLDQLQRLPPEERKQVLQMIDEPTDPPLVEWASNPLKTKASLRRLSQVNECSREELAAHLNDLDELGEVQSMNFGLVGRRTNDLFHVEKRGSKAEDVLSLTAVGRDVAEKFNDDMSGLTPVEKSLYRGLHMYGHYVAFLGELERYMRVEDDPHEDGILKTDLVERLEAYYGNEADSYAGYCGTLCERLGLITRTRDGNQMRYRLTVPREWETTG